MSSINGERDVPKLPYRKILSAVIIWRLSLFFVGRLATFILSYSPSFPYAKEILNSMGLPRWVSAWGGFDGVHYLTIASKGYFGTAFIQAFFPVFPLLISFIQHFFVYKLLSFVMILVFQVIILYFLLILFMSLINIDKKSNVSYWSVVALLFFPTSFFFGAIYGEGIFLFFIFASLLAARKRYWWVAGLFGAFASATRIVGVAIWPALLIELWLQQSKTEVTVENIVSFIKIFQLKILAVSLSFLGLFIYMFYLWKNFNDPLYFFHVQSLFGAGRESSIVLLPQVVWRYFKILTTVPFDLKFYAYLQEFAVSMLFLGLLVFCWKKIRFSYLVFSVLVYLLPTLTGTFSSMPRYVLVCFPVFILIGEWLSKYPKIRPYYFFISGLFAVVNTILFIQGYWVA